MLFAVIAVVLIIKLGSVLGQRTGFQQPLEGVRDVSEIPVEQKIRKLRDDGTGIVQLQVVDPSFDPDGFIDGSKQAFKAILVAFHTQDAMTLKKLLSVTVYKDFVSAFSDKPDEGFNPESIKVKSSSILRARVEGHSAYVTVKFESEQPDADGKSKMVTDTWTFSRNVRSQDPNWFLVTTGA